MATSNAEDIFETFRSFRTSGGIETPEEQFDRYCKDVLSSVEKHHFDYKTKADNRSPNLDESDKKNLAKALSGFANTGGGVLLWGVDEGPPPRLQAITGVEAFLKRLIDLAGQATDPRVQGIDGEWIPSTDDLTAGFAALLIPESPLPPHRVILKLQEVQHHYYIRTAANFDIPSHTHLEDMFGRRPQPKLKLVGQGDFPCSVFQGEVCREWHILCDVVNEGRGIAKLICLEFSPYLDRETLPKQNGFWQYNDETNVRTGRPVMSFELDSRKVIHPGRSVRFLGLHLQVPHFAPREFIKLECTLYCEGAAPVHTTLEGVLLPYTDKKARSS